MEPVQDLIRANFVESNLRLDELHKRLIEIEAVLREMCVKLIPEEKVEDDKPIQYPE